jgi:thioredoxin-related protein
MRQILTTAATLIALAMPAMPAELGEDGLHKEPWFRITFKDLREDLADASEEGKRVALMIEQRGCIYCTKMHTDVYSDPAMKALIEENFFVLQINMFGDEDITDLDGTVLPEKEMVRRWGALFTPTVIFLPTEAPEGQTAMQAAVGVMPGAFGKATTFNMFTWIKDKGYLGDEPFQKYHARMLEERRTAD